MICLFYPVRSNAQPVSPNDLKILSLPPLVLDASTDSGSLLLHLQNQGTTPRSVALSVGNFLNRSTRQEWGAGVTFSAPGVTERNIIFKKELAAGAVETVAVYVSKIWEAGESVAELLDQGKPIGQLKVLKINPAFNVTLLNQAPDKTVLFFERTKPLELILKNDDGMTYPLTLELRFDGQTFPFPGVTLPPRSSTALTIQLPSTAYKRTLAELFNKPLARKGTLLFKLSPPTTLATGPWPLKTIPIEARLSAWSPQWRPVWSMSIIFVVLFLGGICSLVLSAWIPNQRRRLDLKEQLSQLAGRIREISSQMDSALRVAVRMERHRLYKMLFSRWILTPDISTLFNKCSRRIETLDQRIQILTQMDRTRELLNAHSVSQAPPSLLDAVEDALDHATQLLKKSEPRELDLKTAQDLVDGADSLLKKIEQPDPQFKDGLVERLYALKVQFEQGPDPIQTKESCKRIQPQLPEIFRVLSLDPQNRDFDLFRVDSSLLKLDLIKCFILLSESIGSENVVLREEIEGHFLQALRLESRPALRDARLLIRQMEEGITWKILQDEIAKPHSVFIKMDPEEMVRANQPVRFKASLRSPSFNQAAVREQFICDWIFQHDNMTLTEKGWDVTHYFPGSGIFSVTLRFSTMDGRLLATCAIPSAPREGSETVPAKVLPDDSLKSRERFKVELLYLAIVLGGTLLGLMAGAKDKLMELDVAPGLIAVFLLGFGADTVKNLLTQRQSQP